MKDEKGKIQKESHAESGVAGPLSTLRLAFPILNFEFCIRHDD
jgi:hypothetical protein